jgi:hypothetical protein
LYLFCSLRAAAFFPATISFVAVTALFAGASSARAQRTETALDIGGMALRYADTVSTGAAAISGNALFDFGRTVTVASGTFSQFFTGGSSAQGALSGSYFAPTGRGMETEIGAFAGGSSHQDGTQTGQVFGNLRLHYRAGMGELFAGAGLGRSTFGNGAQNMVIGEAGASGRIHNVDAGFVVSPVALDSAKYADTQLSASWTFNNLDFAALAGFRLGDQLEALGGTARGWGSLTLVAWIRPAIAAVLSGGTYPIDPTQGFPGGRFVSASVRFTRGHRRESPPATSVPQVPPPVVEDSAVVESFGWKRISAREVTLNAIIPTARSVEVSGDFTRWVPLKFTSAGDGAWRVTLRLAPGQYQMNLRLDGARWIVPPGLLRITDEFGGAVGLLIVE